VHDKEEDDVTQATPDEDPGVLRARAENERLQRRLDVVQWRVRSLSARRAWRLHAALSDARRGGRGLLLLPVRMVRVLAGPAVVVPHPHA